MNTRTELIARLRSAGVDYDFHENALIFEAADMLEADEKAARLALDALINGKKVRSGEGGTKYQPPLEDASIAALKEVLK